MRLTQTERTALRHALAQLDGPAFLFGSRLNDMARGGDIDVLIFSREEPYRVAQRIAAEFFKYCEEKLDVVVMHPDHRTPEQDAFLQTIQLVPVP